MRKVGPKSEFGAGGYRQRGNEAAPRERLLRRPGRRGQA